MSTYFGLYIRTWGAQWCIQALPCLWNFYIAQPSIAISSSGRLLYVLNYVLWCLLHVHIVPSKRPRPISSDPYGSHVYTLYVQMLSLCKCPPPPLLDCGSQVPMGAYTYIHSPYVGYWNISNHPRSPCDFFFVHRFTCIFLHPCSLTGNNIGDNGAAALATGLQSLTSLQTL